MGKWATKALKINSQADQHDRHLGMTYRVVAKAEAEKPQWDFSQYRGKPEKYMREVLGFTAIWSKIVEVMESLNRPPYKTLVKSGHKIGKCVAVGELLTLADGSRMRVEDLVGQQFELMTLMEGRVVVVDAMAEWNEVEPVWEITTEGGNRIIRNGEHPLWVADAMFHHGRRPSVKNGCWRGASSIKPGQAIAMTETLPAFGLGEMAVEEIKILAYLIGDGGLTKNNLNFTQMEGVQLDEFKACCEALGSQVASINGSKYGYTISGKKNAGKKCDVNRVRLLIREHGLAGKHSRDKRVPEKVFSLRREHIAVFLSRLYATDGWAHAPKQGRAEIGFCSMSEGLVRDIAALLLRFGIHGQVRKKANTEAWCLEIRPAVEILKFINQIGIYGKESAIKRVYEYVNAMHHHRGAWREKNAPVGTRWDKVESVRQLPSAMTVAICVPMVHTYLTDFYEHNSFSAGALINYWFDCFDPGVVITTGPSYESMTDTVWSEVRMQRMRAGLPDCFVGPVTPELWTSPDHWAKLFNVKKTEAFHGKHRPRMLFLFDEAVAVERPMFTVARTMFKPEEGNAWICFYNPTDPSTPIYQEEQSGEWSVFSLSSLDHPNIVRQVEARSQGVELHSRELPIPNAVSLSQIDGWVKEWTSPLDAHTEPLATDFVWQWPDGRKEWRRPMMDWEARCTGNWPTHSMSSIWSDHLITTCAKLVAPVPVHLLPVIGCDVARFGDDETAVHQRWGCKSLKHDGRKGLRVTETAGWLIEIATNLAEMVNHFRREERNKRPVADPKHIQINVDDDGVGGGVVDILHERGYNVVGVNAGSNATDIMRYPNRRSELWFSTMLRAQKGGLSLERIDRESMRRIRLQALAPTWKLDSIGRRVVEPKADTKKRLGRSPDDCDSMNLAYLEIGDNTPSSEYIPTFDDPHLGPPKMTPEGQFRIPDEAPRRRKKLFG